MSRSRLQVVAALVLAGAAACSPNESSPTSEISLPDEIHGLELVDSRRGPDAASAIAGLHEAASDAPAPASSAIGLYGPDTMRAVLYVSRFETAAEAGRQMVAMSTRIGPGAAGYGHHSRAEIAGVVVHTVFGRGTVNYFYARESDLTWLAVPPALARAALAQVLGVATEEVPRLDGRQSET